MQAFELLCVSPCCLVSPCLGPCVGRRFLFCMSFDLACASGRLVRFALSFLLWALVPLARGIFVRLCSTSHPGGNQVDGLPSDAMTR